MKKMEFTKPKIIIKDLLINIEEFGSFKNKLFCKICNDILNEPTKCDNCKNNFC